MTKKIKYIISVIIAIFVVTFGVNATRSLSGSNNSANESETVSYGYFQSLTEAADSALRSLAQKIQLDKFTQQAERLADNAAKYLGTRYRYGSTGPKTFDCSGFIRYVFRQEGRAKKLAAISCVPEISSFSAVLVAEKAV